MVEQLLKEEQADTFHRPARRRYVRNRTYVAKFNGNKQAEFTEMQAIDRQNNGARYLITVINVLTKYVWFALVQ